MERGYQTTSIFSSYLNSLLRDSTYYLAGLIFSAGFKNKEKELKI